MTAGTMSFVPLVAVVLTMVGPTFGSVERVTVQVDGMACPFCAYNIEKRMKTLEGVDGKADFTVSVERGRAELAWRGLVEFDPNAVRERIAAFLPRHRIRLMDEYLSLMVSSNLPAVRPFTNSIILVGLLITFLVVLLSMYTVILERRREIGILKALGASRWNIVTLLLREALLIGVLGVIVGIGATYGVREVVINLRPTMTILITPAWLLQGVLLALGGCTLGSIYPALRAATADPVNALVFE